MFWWGKLLCCRSAKYCNFLTSRTFWHNANHGPAYKEMLHFSKIFVKFQSTTCGTTFASIAVFLCGLNLCTTFPKGYISELVRVRLLWIQDVQNEKYPSQNLAKISVLIDASKTEKHWFNSQKVLYYHSQFNDRRSSTY